MIGPKKANVNLESLDKGEKKSMETGQKKNLKHTQLIALSWKNITGAASGSWWPVTISAHNRNCGESLISAVSNCGHWICHLFPCNSTIMLVYLPIWKSGDTYVMWRWYDTLCRNANMVCGLYKGKGVSDLTARNLTWCLGCKCIVKINIDSKCGHWVDKGL